MGTMGESRSVGDWGDREALVAQQDRVGRLDPPSWVLPEEARVAGCFVAFAQGEAGPGRAGDRAWVGAALMGVGGDGLSELGTAVVTGYADGSYEPGLLALREGRLLYAALLELLEHVGRPDVVMVDATGRDHPRRCGVALHLGWALDVPTVGVTHRLLTGRERRPPPLDHRGDWAPIGAVVEAPPGEPPKEVARWVCTRDGVRPLVCHAGWRTEAATAADLVVRCATEVRTPEPLRRAREVARTARGTSHGARGPVSPRTGPAGSRPAPRAGGSRRPR